MIREITCYVCVCSKCGHQWTTKTNDLPKVCSSCKRVTWNDDFKWNMRLRELKLQQPLPPIPVWSEATEQSIINPALGKFLSQNDGEPHVLIVQPDEWRFTKDKPQFADDGNVYRLQCLVSDPRKTRTVRVDELDHDEILSVNKKR